MNIRKLFLLSLVVTLSTQAWEVDDFSNRKEILGISPEDKAQNLYRLNDQSNRYFYSAIKEFNRKRSCVDDMKKNPPEIYSRVKRVLGGGMVEGALEDWVQNSKKMVKSKGDQALYGTPWSIDPSFNLNGHVVGIDKLGHFADQGFELFEAAYLNEGANLEKAFELSNTYEDYVFGISASGVKSYADMAAGYNGMQFYMNLLHGEGKYLTCNKSTGSYEILRDFDWADYVNDSWDEGINCSMYYRAKFPYDKTSYIRQEKELLEGDSLLSFMSDKASLSSAGVHFKNRMKQKGMSCPANFNQCKKMAKMECSTRLISPDCLIKASPVLVRCKEKKLGDFGVPSAKSGYSYSRSDSFGTGSSNSWSK
ncbi:hypothetical protein A9Q84_19520 [Halobacteriovorax marinus]|uniref:Lipoprotein n=1 Tax=Halobacteriovorax marinus TaxID=97084 RepID=A0A1Y5F8D4_9BACT|nr:hypothetical protein A9Q84_19520 [Halobacteriovorax marinus]